MNRKLLYGKLAKSYDKIYYGKNYQNDITIINKILKKHNAKQILDLGCGTGTHAFLLGEKGYIITGVDQSNQILKIAKKKNKLNKNKFINAKIETLNLRKKFDAGICLFSTILYFYTNKKIENLLKSVKNSLKKNGLLIIQFSTPLSLKNKFDRINGDGIYVLKKDIIDFKAQTIKSLNEYYSSESNKSLGIDSSIKRILFPQEMCYFLEKNNYKIEKLSIKIKEDRVSIWLVCRVK